MVIDASGLVCFNELTQCSLNYVKESFINTSFRTIYNCLNTFDLVELLYMVH